MDNGRDDNDGDGGGGVNLNAPKIISWADQHDNGSNNADGHQRAFRNQSLVHLYKVTFWGEQCF